MIENILKKAENNKELKKDELIELFKISDKATLKKLLKISENIRNQTTEKIKLTSTIHLTNHCKIKPRCGYCGFAVKTSKQGYYTPFYKSDDEILTIAKYVEKSNIPRVSCSGGYGFDGKHAVNAVKLIKDNTDLEILVNVGADLTRETIKELKKYNTDTICCNLETTNKELFDKVKPGDNLEDRINACRNISKEGVELSSGLLIGLGESYEDRVNHLLFLKEFETLGEIPIMGFNPYEGTPMENHPPCPIDEQLKTIAITRILYPDLRITVPTPTIGTKNLEYSLLAGANNIATVIPTGYPLEVKGVGSPDYGNLSDVLDLLKQLKLTPQTL